MFLVTINVIRKVQHFTIHENLKQFDPIQVGVSVCVCDVGGGRSVHDIPNNCLLSYTKVLYQVNQLDSI